MECLSCADFRRRVLIRDSGQLRACVQQVEHALAAGRLCCAADPIGRPPTPRPPFAALRADGVLPEVVHHHFTCIGCGQRFVLLFDTRYGAGGQWWMSGKLAAERLVPPAAAPRRGRRSIRAHR
jgi:hypothetical protein